MEVGQGKGRRVRTVISMVWKNKFHERINELWKRAKGQNSKLTQAEYAGYLGVTRNALLGWLRGSGQPDTDGLVRIASTENISLSWLLGAECSGDKDESPQDEQEILYIYRSISPEHKEILMELAKKFQMHDRKLS